MSKRDRLDRAGDSKTDAVESAFTWMLRGSTWALLRPDPLRFGQTIIQYIRWSESGEQYVDMRGLSLGTDLEKAKRTVESSAALSDQHGADSGRTDQSK